MINYSIAEFLGIFCLGFPILLFLITAVLRGFFSIIEHFFHDEEDEEEDEDFFNEKRKRRLR